MIGISLDFVLENRRAVTNKHGAQLNANRCNCKATAKFPRDGYRSFFIFESRLFLGLSRLAGRIDEFQFPDRVDASIHIHCEWNQIPDAFPAGLDQRRPYLIWLLTPDYNW